MRGPALGGLHPGTVHAVSLGGPIRLPDAAGPGQSCCQHTAGSQYSPPVPVGSPPRRGGPVPLRQRCQPGVERRGYPLPVHILFVLIHFVSPSSNRLSRDRARESRDRTVPSACPVSRAISPVESPS